MIHVGVDIGKSMHAAAAVNEAGAVVMQPRSLTQDAGGYASLFGALSELGGADSVAVGMEATGHYWKVRRHALAARGYRVDVINPLVTAREASADVRGRKTDKLDAIAIANVMRKGGYSPAPAELAATDALKSLARHRKALVSRRSDAKLRLIAALDVAFPEATKTLGDLFGTASLAVVKTFPSARVAADADIRKLTSLFSKASGGQLGREAAEAYREAARHSLSLNICNEGEEFVISQTVDEIRAANSQIDAAEKRMLTEPQPFIAGILGSIKGAGRIQPLAVASEIGDLSRFAGANMKKKVLAYAGCEPRVRESGKWKGRTKMSKRGSPALRNALYLMAGTIRLHSPGFNEVYSRQIAKGKHHNVALSHVVRKIVDVMCGMYKTNTSFIPPQVEPVPCQ
ncbi:MAG: IS110 family transposase [Kiritimatiellae bacterium]|nr:IS110 family transposase [Kiritimatiellia bacterium]